MSLRLLVADDHQIMREGLRSMLAKQPDMEVVGEAGDGRTTVQLTREISPDVVIMDVAMPYLDGIDATRQINAELPDTKIIALSMHADRPFVYEMLRAGAVAYLLKDSAFDELIHAIREVMDDRIYLSPSIAGTVIDDFVQQLAKDTPSAKTILTPRELEVLQLLAEGKSAKEAAFQLRLSVKTIETHRRQIMKKLDLPSMAALIKYAVREGLTSL